MSPTYVLPAVSMPSSSVPRGSHSNPSAPADGRRDALAQILDALGQAVATVDSAGRIVDWNSGAEELFGWLRNDVRGLALGSLAAPAEGGGLDALLDPTVHQTEAALVGRRKDRKLIELNTTIAHVAAADGVQFVLTFRDESARRSLDQERQRELLAARLQSQTASLSLAGKSLPDALRQCLDAVCQATQSPIGHAWLLEGDRLVSSRIWHVDDPAMAAPFRALTEKLVLARGEELPGRIWAASAPFWIGSLAQDDRLLTRRRKALPDWEGAFGFPVVVGGDLVAVLEFYAPAPYSRDSHWQFLARSIGERLGVIVERNRAEQERAWTAAIVESSYDAIIGRDLTGKIISWNEGAERTYGYAAEEALGSAIQLILPPNQDGEEPEILRALQSGARLSGFEAVRRRQDGRLITVSITISPIVNAQGRLMGLSTIERDVSRRKEQEEALKRAKEEAEEASRAKSEFLANMSHEIRTPMNAVLGMAELALGEPLSPVVRDYLETAYDSARTLLLLLNDILDFSRLEAGRLDLERAPFALRQTLEQTLRTSALRAHEKGLELALDVGSDVPDRLEGDSLRLSQVMMNLVGNAVKFTEQGEVLTQVRVESRDGDKVCLRFAVIDTGIGIAPDDQKRIFDPFEQADASSTRRYSGAGLGLAICRQLMDRMGGRMWVESEHGKGSSFYATACFRLLPDNTVLEPQVRELQGLPVLVVDDNDTQRRVLCEILTGWSMRPTPVKSTPAALAELASAAGRGQPFPLMLVDAIMPGEDGCALVEQAAERGVAPAASILMLASGDHQTYRSRYERLPIAACLAKPASQSDLLNALMTALHGPPLDDVAVHEVEKAAHPLRVLLAEDTPANQKVAKAILEKRGHVVVAASNGSVAVDQHLAGKFDVILMDVQMPVLDGYQATRQIRAFADAQKSRIPIIAMTAHAMQGDRERCLSAGMDAYLSKPINARWLIELVERHGVRAAAEQQATADGPAPAEYDLDSALVRLGNDPQLLCDLIQFFLDDSPGLLDEIDRGLGSGDCEQAARAAHSLKGLAANFNAVSVTEVARELEREARAGNAEAASRLAAAVRKSTAALRACLERDLGRRGRV